MKFTNLLFLLLPFIAFSQNSVLKKKISEIVKNKNATVSVSVSGIDFPFDYSNQNAGKKLPMLSTFKFHIGLTVLDFVDTGKLDLNQKIFIKKEDLKENTYSPLQKEFPDGNLELTLDEVLKYTICKSDNNTTDILLKLIGGTQSVQNFMNEKNVKPFQIKYNEEQMHKGAELLYGNYTTTNTLNALLKSFYLNKIISKKSTDYLYKLMQETTTGANKLSEQLPKNSIAHRTGSSGKIETGLTIAENDIGIITLPNGKHYAISVFINDSMESEDVNCKMISDISKTVWDFLNK